MGCSTMKHSHFALLALLSLATSSRALADANIVVDGKESDWHTVPTCFNEPIGDVSGTLDLNRICVTNNNAGGDAGSLFGLFEATSAFPSGGGQYVMLIGFALDTNHDAQITDEDDAFLLAFTSHSGKQPSQLEVRSAVSFTPRPGRTYTNRSSCGGTPTSNGWSGHKQGRIVEIAIAYGCLGLSYGNDDQLIQLGIFGSNGNTAIGDRSTIEYYDGTNGTLGPPGPPPVVSNLTAVARDGSATLVWDNPAQHNGVLIVRTTGTPPTPPSKGVQYSRGQRLGTGVVAYADKDSTATSFTDTGLINGTTYRYYVYNHHQHHTYSLAAPSAAGLLVVPTPGTAGTPLWCYSTGFPALMQPVIDAGKGIFHAGNSGLIAANRTIPADPANDGAERWRPFKATAPIQSRFPVVPVANGSRVLFSGDQSGYTWALNPETGARIWGGATGVRVGTGIQAQPVLQLAAFANEAYKTARGNRDLVFFASRTNASPRVVALNADDGTVAWQANAPGMGVMSGGMLVDYVTNQLWVASKGGTAGKHLWIFSTLDGRLVDSLTLADSDYSVNPDSKSGQIYFTANGSRQVMGIDRVTRATVWTYTLPATPRTWVYPTGAGFIASLSDGTVRRYSVSGSTVTELWSQPASVPGPSGVVIDYATQKIYAGGNDGRVYEIAVADGAITSSISFGASQQIGQPTLDASARRLFVGTQDGRVCALGLPF